jgi:hypothetical protein
VRRSSGPTCHHLCSRNSKYTGRTKHQGDGRALVASNNDLPDPNLLILVTRALRAGRGLLIMSNKTRPQQSGTRNGSNGYARTRPVVVMKVVSFEERFLAFIDSHLPRHARAAGPPRYRPR